jgi:capsular polysaccharide export protein
MIDVVVGTPRTFLFLQGMANTFFAKLAAALVKRGHRAFRVNFNGGDRLFWPLPNAVDFCRKSADWPEFIERRLIEWQVTDLVLFGDGRSLHQEAVRIARARDVTVHVFEEGYFRPDWVTHERDGVNGNSTLPRDLAWYLREVRALTLSDKRSRIRSSFFRRSVDDVLYNLSSLALTWRYPHYRTHRPWPFWVEYASWLRRRILKAPVRAWRCRRALKKIATRPGMFFLFPLQVDSDYQIRHHSPHGRIAPVVDEILQSFTAHAPADALLVAKEHPLDNALTDWRSLVEDAAWRLGIGDRVVYLTGGSLERLLDGTSGVVTVNSTVGARALARGVPVIALGRAIYDIAGITFQGSLDEFWRQPLPANPEAFDAFRRVTIHRTQINGGFYSATGLRLAVAGAIPRLEGGWSCAFAQIGHRPSPGLFPLRSASWG